MIESRTTISKVITAANQEKGKYSEEPMRELKLKNRKLPKAQENGGYELVIGVSFSSGVSFASDLLIEWRDFFGPISERGKGNPMHSRNTFDTQMISSPYDLNIWQSPN